MTNKHHHGITASIIVILVVVAAIFIFRPEANKYSTDPDVRTYVDKGLTPEAQAEFGLRVSTLKASIDAADEFNAHDYLLLGNLYYQTGELALAKEAYEAILEKNSDDVGALENLGVTLEQMHDYKGAAQTWTKSLSLSGNVGIVINLVDVIENHIPEQYDRVDDILELSIQSLGQDEQLNTRLAKWFFENGQYDKAQSNYEVAETLSGKIGKYTERIAEARRQSIESAQ